MSNEIENWEDDEYSKYEKDFSDDAFWEKLKKFTKKLGLKSTSYALILYYVLQKPEVPKTDKALIVGCLGYLILPLDLIPDLAPIIGYSDDVTGMLFAVKRCLGYVDTEIKEKVSEKLISWFKVDDNYVDELLENI